MGAAAAAAAAATPSSSAPPEMAPRGKEERGSAEQSRRLLLAMLPPPSSPVGDERMRLCMNLGWRVEVVSSEGSVHVRPLLVADANNASIINHNRTRAAAAGAAW